MPFYEYQCKSCGHALEAMQKFSDAPLKKCPDCGKSQLVRLMSAPVFRLKGAGWYETDFKGDKENQRNLADRPEPDAPKDAKGAEAGATEAKPAEDGKSAQAKVSDAASGDATGAKDKPADKTADKTTEKAVDKPAERAVGKSAVACSEERGTGSHRQFREICSETAGKATGGKIQAQPPIAPSVRLRLRKRATRLQ
jgi:putative FmdB family regulatory protein